MFENFKLYNVAQNETRYENTNKQENTLFTEWNAFAKVEDDAQIILPAAANFLDTQTDVNYDQAGGSILGTLVYSYGGRQVGTANVVTTGAKVAEYPFGENPEPFRNQTVRRKMILPWQQILQIRQSQIQ